MLKNYNMNRTPNLSSFKASIFLKGPYRCVSSNIQYISTVKTQHMQGPDVYYNCVLIL